MKTKLLLKFGAFALTLCLASASESNMTRQKQEPLVRIAELDIDPAQLESYKAFLKEEIEASIRIEPGVLTLYAVAEKEYPTRIHIFETYASVKAY